MAGYRLYGYSWEIRGSKQVAYLFGDKSIGELYATLNGDWDGADLTLIAGGPPAQEFGLVNGYGWDSGRSKQVVFRTLDGHIHELYVRLGGEWSHEDLTAIAAAPPSNLYDEGIHAFSWEAGNAKQVVYKTSDGHLHELSVRFGEVWTHADLTAISGSPPAYPVDADPFRKVHGYEDRLTGSKSLVYVAADGHIHELAVSPGGKWQHADVTAIAGAPSVSIHSGEDNSICGFGWQAGAAKQVVFRTVDGHLHELLFQRAGCLGPESTWQHVDMTAAASCPAAVFLLNGYACEYGKSKHVLFLTGDSHIHELSQTVGGAWMHSDLTAVTGAPIAEVASNGYSWEAGRSRQVVFLAVEPVGSGLLAVHELYLREGDVWRHARLQA